MELREAVPKPLAGLVKAALFEPLPDVAGSVDGLRKDAVGAQGVGAAGGELGGGVGVLRGEVGAGGEGEVAGDAEAVEDFGGGAAFGEEGAVGSEGELDDVVAGEFVSGCRSWSCPLRGRGRWLFWTVEMLEPPMEEALSMECP